MKYILILLTLLMVTGCSGRLVTSDVTKDNAEDLTDSIRYVWEPKHYLCFATVKSSTYGWFTVVSIALVPSDNCSH